MKIFLRMKYWRLPMLRTDAKLLMRFMLLMIGGGGIIIGFLPNSHPAPPKSVEQIITEERGEKNKTYRLIILPACSSCYKDVIDLLKSGYHIRNQEQLLLVGRDAALNILKEEVCPHNNDCAKVILYKQSKVNLSGFADEKTYLFSAKGEVITSEYLNDYLNRTL